MAQSLESFLAELRTDVDRFEKAYRAKVAEIPEHYPLTMVDGNEGLWFEFFTTFVTTGEA
ncbi:hypothetical protein [Paraburkholderia sp. SIMBA_054]|uniref:hypothetical protein n=1 Tax=Paraburkholderia sp. SIMBA_054 TaxID=3085795 RepID=UPI003979A5E6